MRKLWLDPVIVGGGCWLAGAVALDYPPKTQAVDDLTSPAGAIAKGRRRNVEPIEITPSEPAIVA